MRSDPLSEFPGDKSRAGCAGDAAEMRRADAGVSEELKAVGKDSGVAHEDRRPPDVRKFSSCAAVPGK